MPNPCQICGACCAFYKVAVQVLELEVNIPLELTVESGRSRRVMKGTIGFNKRCTALAGTIGVSVSCLIYDRRPATCRNFKPGWDLQGAGNPLCDRARAVYGMTPFESR